MKISRIGKVNALARECVGMAPYLRNLPMYGGLTKLSEEELDCITTLIIPAEEYLTSLEDG